MVKGVVAKGGSGGEEKEEPQVQALSVDEIALLKSYGLGPYATRVMEVKNSPKRRKGLVACSAAAPRSAGAVWRVGETLPRL